jgi:hypothetical protein
MIPNNQGISGKRWVTYVADKNGYVALPAKVLTRTGSYSVDINFGNESLKDWGSLNTITSSNEDANNTIEPKKIFFFADRSIYRPGQTVYFKGIVVQSDTNSHHHIVPDFSTTVYLYNANSEKVDSLKVTTNSYGSFQGRFQLPSGGLNGNFTLEDKERNNNISFSVEEYKRPKFSVTYAPLTNTYKVGDTITVTGIASAYAGNVIDGAQVSYRVVRQARFPYEGWYRKSWLPQVAPLEITHGTTTTDAQGNFKISFVAMPDLSISKVRNPIFDYLVYADVTDLNGETRSAELSVSAGYQSLLLNVQADKKMNLDSLLVLQIRTENMNGIFQPTLAEVRFIRLEPEMRMIRKRLWEQPDQFIMSREQFIALFPNDEYRNESEPETWQRGAQVLLKKDSTTTTGTWSIGATTLTPGYYEIETITKDKEGHEIKDSRVVELYSGRDKSLSYPAYIWAIGSQPVEPGQSARVQIGSAAKNIFLIRQSGRRSEKGQPFSFHALSQEKKDFTTLATEEDRGGISEAYVFVKENRVYQYGALSTFRGPTKNCR